MTRRGVGLAIGVVALWTAARALGIPELHSLAVGALVLLVAALLLSRVVPTQLRVQRSARPATLGFGERGSVQLTLTNTGWLPTPPLDVIDTVPASLVEQATARLPPLGPGRQITVTYALHGRHRGRATVGPLTIRGRDPFGLAQRRRTLPGTVEVVVLPPVVTLPAGLPLGSATGSSAERRRRLSTSGEELSDIREYVHGEDLRTVHWPSTAHRGKLMVRRSEDVLTARATILLDLRPSRHAGIGPVASVEAAITAAASATRHLDERGRGVVVLDRPVQRTPTALPAAQWLRRLAETEPEETDVDALLRQVAMGVAEHGTLLAILPLPQDGELNGLVRAGRSASSRLALILDTGTFAGQRPDPAVDRGVAGLTAAGWRATPLRRGDDLAECWRALIGQGRRHGTRVG